MSELGQDARSVVAQARAADGPSAEDRARIRAKLDPAWAAFRARQASAQPSRAAAALARRPTPWGAFAVWLSLTLWPAERPRFEALGELAALQPMAAASSASRAAHAPQLMASGSGASSATSQNRPAPAAGASASHDGSAKQASLAALLAHGAQGGVAARADSRRPGPIANAASRSASGAGARAPGSARGAAVPTVRLGDTSRAAYAGQRATTAPNLGRSATTASATAADLGRSATTASATAADLGRSATTASATAANLGRSATTASATPTNAARSGPFSSAAAPDAATSSAREAPLAPSSTARGGAMAEAGDATPSQRNPGFVPQPLDDELEWIGAAQDALRKGQPSSVLRLVQEHAFRYPQGALTPERLALHALALCALQRRAAARTVLADLARRTPSSPLLDRVQRSCGL